MRLEATRYEEANADLTEKILKLSAEHANILRQFNMEEAKIVKLNPTEQTARIGELIDNLQDKLEHALSTRLRKRPDVARRGTTNRKRFEKR